MGTQAKPKQMQLHMPTAWLLTVGWRWRAPDELLSLFAAPLRSAA
jgi:hypothetical protein